MTTPTSKWLPSIVPSEMLGRLILAALVMASLTSLGLWLNSGSLLSWFATVLVMSVTTFTSWSLRFDIGPAFAKRTQVESNPHPLLGLIASKLGFELASIERLVWVVGRHPILRPFATHLGLRLVVSFSVGLFVSTVEQLVAAAISGATQLPMDVAGLFSLSIVLLPTYVLLGHLRRHRAGRSTWRTDYEAAIADAVPTFRGRPLSPATRNFIVALLKTLATVLFRLVTVAILPAIFSNVFGAAFFAITGVLIIVGGDVLFELGRTIVAASKPNTRESENENQEGPKA